MLRSVLSVASALLALAPLPALADPPAPPKIQYVLISFDGAHELAQWKRSRALAKQTGAKFTYFLSCVFLLSNETRKAYQPPAMRAGRSNVGFAASRAEVEQRLYQIRLAVGEGHELASHGCGHFDGGKWTEAEWKQEFAQFKAILRGAYSLNGLPHEPADWQGIVDRVKGFRAPYLSANPALHAALSSAGFAYDASGVSRGPITPPRGGLARFALPQIPEGPTQKPVIAMDYNLFARHTRAIETPDTDGAFEARTLAAFRQAFGREYGGERRPLQLGFHFTLMNGAAYWRALEAFTAETCGKPQVACVTYGDYLKRTRPDATTQAHAG
jgi:peptidoglycan/xylan/chitin deacetylase (PgdA/CDA1 family)